MDLPAKVATGKIIVGKWCRRDFTLRQYGALLCDLRASGYALMPVAEFLQGEDQRAVALRHDVDCHIMRSVRMALLEFALGVKAT